VNPQKRRERIVEREDIPAAEAAVRLSLSRERLIRMVQTGRLLGRRDAERGWLVSAAAVEALAAERAGVARSR
jgi:hypothetical protein